MKASIRSTAVAALCVTLLLLASCGGGGGGAAPPAVDTVSPSVVSTVPPAGASGVPVASVLSATFDEALDPASVNATTFTLRDAGNHPVAGTVRATGNTASFVPSASLAPLLVHTATISGVRDLAGNLLAGSHVWVFTTGAAPDTTPPAVTATTPTAGATGVVADTELTVSFSEAIDPATVTAASFSLRDAGNSPIAGSLSCSGSTARFVPGGNLAFSTVHTATLTAAITDLAGNPLTAAQSWSFTTGVTVSLAQPVSLQAAGSYPVLPGFDPVAADLNDDGHLDLALPVYGGHVSVLLGNGDGSFGARTDFPVGQTARALVAADFNSDGKVDIAVVREFVTSGASTGAVTVIHGDGSGGFGAPIDHVVGAWPLELVSADFNADGKPDIAAANRFGDSVSVLLANGTGSLAAPVAYPAGDDPVSIAGTDLNADGKVDLVVSSGDGAAVRVLLGNGDGSFAAPNSFAAGAYPFSVRTGDLNGDGKVDVAAANEADYVSVLPGDGAGALGGGTPHPVTRYPRGLDIADLNHDGIPDLVVATMMNAGIGSNSVYLLLGRGGGLFEAATIAYTVGGSSILLPGVGIGDLDADGRPDLAINDPLLGMVVILLNAAP